jgi:hypothetical protein
LQGIIYERLGGVTPGLFLCDYCNSLSEEDRDKREKWILFYFEQVSGGIRKYNGGDKCDLRVAHFWLADMAQFKLALKTLPNAL